MLLRMVASRTFYRWLSAFCDVAAHEALPYHRFVALPHGAVFDALAHLVETFAVMILDCSDGAEAVCYLGESLFVGHLGCVGVKHHTLLFLFGGCYLKVVDSLSDYAGINSNRFRSLTITLGKIFKEYLGMMKLIVGSFIKYIGILEV